MAPTRRLKALRVTYLTQSLGLSLIFYEDCARCAVLRVHEESEASWALNAKCLGGWSVCRPQRTRHRDVYRTTVGQVDPNVLRHLMLE
jgi:hypothetical protein